MLTSLKLTNFQKHESLSLDFAGGLVVIRGANEAGKSSIYRAVAYALYGSRALPKSLDRTVTYGKSPGSLKVELEFTHGGASYKIVRSKSGATITGNGVSAEGQTEVTGFVEKLFGVTMQVAPRIMIANQKNLVGALEEDGSAVKIIEALSGMELIENLITKVQEQLPCGNTAWLEKQATEAAEQRAPILQEDAEQAAVAQAEAAVEATEAALQEAQAALAELDLEGAAGKVQFANLQASRKADLEKSINRLQATLAAPLSAPVDDIPALQAAKDQQEQYAARRRAYDLYKTQVWEEGYNLTNTALKEEARYENSKLGEAFAEKAKLEKSKAVAESQMITATACGLCGKDLSAVPEVVEKNSNLLQQIAVADDKLTSLTQQEARLRASLLDRQKALDLDAKQELLQSRLHGFVTADLSQTPRLLTWIGEPPKVLPLVNYDERIRAAQKSATDYEIALALRKQASADLAEATDELSRCVVPDVSEAQAVLAEVRTRRAAVEVERQNLAVATKEQAAAQAKLAAVQADWRAKVSAWQANLAHAAKVQESLKAYYLHNALIKKLRDARPVVASTLWGTVLLSVSHYFSQVRGVPSTVTKGEEGFLVDGKPISDLSGSTIDSLGLAVRMALQKTFLPALDFMMLDEPAAAADAEREVNMLGAIAAAGYEQVILVTHSDLADTFASQVLTL